MLKAVLKDNSLLQGKVLYLGLVAMKLVNTEFLGQI